VRGTTPTSESTPTWTWTSSGEGNGTFRFKLDDSDLTSGAPETTDTRYTPTGTLADGSHTLYVQERDAAGNWSASGSFTITIDTTPPTVTIGSPSPTVTQTGPVNIPLTIAEATTVTLTADDVTLTSADGVTGDVRVSNGTTGAPTVTIANLTGHGTVRISLAAGIAHDAAGNPSAAAGPSDPVMVDTTVPTVSIDTAPADLTSTTSASFTFTGDDGSGSGLATTACQVDGGGWHPCSSPVSYDALGDGDHTVTIRATDHAGNTASASHTWTVDTTAPAAPVVISDLTTADRTPVITGTAELGSTVTVALDRDGDGTPDIRYETVTDDAGTWRIATATDRPLGGSLLPDGLTTGAYALTITSTDPAGNEAVIAPTLTIEPEETDPPDTPHEHASRLYLPLVVR
jgi:hypothetical protein